MSAVAPQADAFDLARVGAVLRAHLRSARSPGRHHLIRMSLPTMMVMGPVGIFSLQSVPVALLAYTVLGCFTVFASLDALPTSVPVRANERAVASTLVGIAHYVVAVVLGQLLSPASVYWGLISDGLPLEQLLLPMALGVVAVPISFAVISTLRRQIEVEPEEHGLISVFLGWCLALGAAAIVAALAHPPVPILAFALWAVSVPAIRVAKPMLDGIKELADRGRGRSGGRTPWGRLGAFRPARPLDAVHRRAILAAGVALCVAPAFALLLEAYDVGRPWRRPISVAAIAMIGTVLTLRPWGASWTSFRVRLVG